MKLEQQVQGEFDPELYARNRSRVGPDYLGPYVGRYVAWHLDGARIVASAPDPGTIEGILKDQGIDPRHVVYQFVRTEDVSQPDGNGVPEDPDSVPYVDSWAFSMNVNLLPTKERVRYAGQYVAFSLDGTRILAGDPNGELAVMDRLKAMGLDPRQAVYDFIDPWE